MHLACVLSLSVFGYRSISDTVASGPLCCPSFSTTIPQALLFRFRCRAAPVRSPKLTDNMASSSVGVSPVKFSDALQPELTAYAKRLPKLKKTGDISFDAKRELEYSAMQQSISLLQAHPHLAMETLCALQANIGQQKRKRISDEDREPKFSDKECAVVGKLPEQWFAGWLQCLTNGALTDELLGKALRHGGATTTTIMRLRKFALQVSDTTQLPSECAVEKVCARMLNDRHHTIGSPISQAWVEASISISGEINWKDRGFLCEHTHHSSVSHGSGDRAAHFGRSCLVIPFPPRPVFSINSQGSPEPCAPSCRSHGPPDRH